MGPEPPSVGSPEQEHRRSEDARRESEQEQTLGITRIDGERNRSCEKHDRRSPLIAAQNQDYGGKKPSPPGHDRGQRPSEIPDEWAAQLEDDRRRRAAERPQAKHLPEHVDARAGDHDGDDKLGSVSESDGEQVSDQDGKAQGSRLPVESERHP